MDMALHRLVTHTSDLAALNLWILITEIQEYTATTYKHACPHLPYQFIYIYYFFFLTFRSVAVILLNIQHAYEGYVIYQAAVLGQTQFPTPIALLAGPKAGMALVGHADANRHAQLNTRKLPVYSTCRLCQQTQTLNLFVVVQGQNHNGLCSR
jgi:hypothetical protein